MLKIYEAIEAFALKFITHYIDYFVESYIMIIIFFSIPLIVLSLEWLMVGWDKSSFKRLLKPNGSAKNDLVSFLFVNTKIEEILGYAFLFGMALYIPQGIRSMFGYNLLHAIPFPLAQAIIAFLIIDFLDYWKHRLEHKLSPLWELHKYHHSSTEFNMISAQRSHPLMNISFRRLLIAIPLAIAGAPIISYFGFVVFRRILGLLHHSEFGWNFGWIGKYIFISPMAHRLHHSIEEYHFNKNFGVTMVWWDKLFGTWMEPNHNIKPIIGVRENTLNHPNYFVNILGAIKNAWLKLVG